MGAALQVLELEKQLKEVLSAVRASSNPSETAGRNAGPSQAELPPPADNSFKVSASDHYKL